MEFVEMGCLDTPQVENYLKELLGPYLSRYSADAIVLGCTHYPLIRKTIGHAAGEGVSLINPAYETAMELRSMLDNMGLLADHRPALGTGVPQYRFYVSDMANQFQQFANSIIKYGILASEKIDIHTYSSAPLSAGEKS